MTLPFADGVSPAPYNGEVQAWTYDGIGNRTSAGSSLGTQRPYTYFKNGSNPLNGQRLQSDGVSTYGYDANGNTTSRTGSPGAFTFGWDAEDRMISIAGGVSASYAYDYQGRRTRKTVGGVSSTYLYDGLNLVRTTGADQVDVLFGPGIDEPLAMAHNGSVYYFSVGGLGSVVLLTTSGGAVQNASLYDAWGERRHQSGSLPQPFAYTAREPAEAGLWYYRARYYQPGIGRFGSEDPLRHMDGPSLYAYAGSRPIAMADPTGKFSMDGSCLPLSNDQWRDLQMGTHDWCTRKMAGITNPKLRACMEESCRSGKIRCRCDCPRGQLGGTVDVIAAQVRVDRTAPVCTNNWPDVKAAGPGDVVIHEWAHGCGWLHGQGGGVPGDSGVF